MSDLDELARAVSGKGNRVHSVGGMELIETSPPRRPVSYGGGGTRQGMLARYVAWAGLRSILCQIVFLVWTVPTGAMYTKVMAEHLRDEVAQSTAVPTPYAFGAAVRQDQNAIYWVTLFWGILWAPVGVPFGLAAIVLLGKK